MARYYVSFQTMKLIMGMPLQPKMSDVVSVSMDNDLMGDSIDPCQLSAIVQADEYRDIRFKSYEKKLFKEINRHTSIKFPIKVDISQDAHKRCLIIQAELGCVDFPSDEEFVKLRSTYGSERSRLFSSVHRIVRCAIDCQIETKDSVGVRNSLELARSLGAKVWDNSPFQMKQIPQIGPVAIRKLVNGGITSLDMLEATDPHRIEMLLSKNPPFGSKIITTTQTFPKLRVSIKLIGKVGLDLWYISSAESDRK